MTLFVCGAGDVGQLGVEKGRRWTDWNTLKLVRNTNWYGSNEGAGLTSVAAAGVHSSFPDEDGTVT